jgi:hypothetical protein
MLVIKCLQCGGESSLSFSQSVYEGPYRCAKCRNLFTIRIENNELKLYEPLSQEEFERWQELNKASNEQDEK